MLPRGASSSTNPLNPVLLSRHLRRARRRREIAAARAAASRNPVSASDQRTAFPAARADGRCVIGSGLPSPLAVGRSTRPPVPSSPRARCGPTGPPLPASVTSPGTAPLDGETCRAVLMTAPASFFLALFLERQASRLTTGSLAVIARSARSTSEAPLYAALFRLWQHVCHRARVASPRRRRRSPALVDTRPRSAAPRRPPEAGDRAVHVEADQPSPEAMVVAPPTRDSRC